MTLLLAEFEASEAADADVLAGLRDRFLYQLLDGLRAVADERLLHQHGLFDAAINAGREIFLGNGDGGRDAGDLHRDVVRERLEGIGAGDEVGLAVDFDDHTYAPAGVDVRLDEALGRLAVRLVLGAGDPLLAQERGGTLDVAIRLVERALAVHDAGTALLAEA